MKRSNYLKTFEAIDPIRNSKFCKTRKLEKK